MIGKSSTLTHAAPFFTRVDARPVLCPSAWLGVRLSPGTIELDSDGI
jgi:hypothetical protein